jgi:3-phosphoshikimate 1-carboxyvinyltransferase
MKLNIAPTPRLNGTIRAPGSKSYSHRAFIAAALSKGVSIIKNPLISGDVAVTINLLRKIGIRILKKEDNSFVIAKETESFLPYNELIDCKNSGTSIRFFCALSLIVDEGLTLTGTFLKKHRPIVPLLEALTKLGASYKLTESEIHIKRINDHCDKIQIIGNVSSQFISALLMVCPVLYCENDCFIHIKSTTPVVSYPYLEITKNILDSFEISIQEIIQPDNTIQYTIRCSQNYRPQVYDVPGDFSSAAFIIAAVLLTKKDSKVTIQNLNFRKPQADKKFIEILKNMGAKIDIDKNNNQLTVYGNLLEHPLLGIDIDCQNIPDLFPILSIIGVFAEGKTMLYNASHLRYKESDRIAIISRELQKLGVKVDETADTLTVYHTKTLRESAINHENDHRIAMAFIILCLSAKSSSKMSNIEIINDSYPDFLSHLKQIGANIKIDNEQIGQEIT